MKTENEILKEAIKLFKPSKRNIGECIEKAISLTKQSERKRILELIDDFPALKNTILGKELKKEVGEK